MDFGTGSTSSSFPSSSTFGYTYDVFLSFRGADTRSNFAADLYNALVDKGIRPFRDDTDLELGSVISSNLLKAIEESRFAVVILSRNYASSTWCLDELAKIIECRKKTGLTVLPVFYDVEPSDVRNLGGVFKVALAEHSVRFKNHIEKVDNWRDALVKVGNVAGWDLRHRGEVLVIKEIVRKIYGHLNSIYSIVHEDCVGLDSRVTEIYNSYLGIGLEDVRFIGIWGMGGMGKTTLARVLHQRIHNDFDASSFIGNVREESCKNGLSSLQNKLLDDILNESNTQLRDIQWGTNVIHDRLCKKKVLIILDDVDQPEQLKALAGKRDWFGEGSRIIITTRNQRLLITHDITKAEIYEVKKLNDNEALKLFSREVFKKDWPPADFMEMSQNVIHYTGGLPLALKVLGASLMKREPVVWKNILAKLKEDPPRQLMDVLAISFNGLDSKEKNLFLDIACFFKGKKKGWVASILQTSIEIDTLMEKSLINISRFGTLWMHDTLQNFGREIVRSESKELGQQSRLWLSEDIFCVLERNIGKQKVEGIFLSSSFLEEKEHLNTEVYLEPKVFKKMINLRLLRINHVHLCKGLDYLSNKLCFMNWEKYPLESLPESFHPNKLVELIMHASNLKQLWMGKKSSEMLKHIDLSYSKELIMIPDVTEIPNLEKLILKGCTSLSEIHTSLGDLKKLNLLNLRNCKSLLSLPDTICCLTSLKLLTLSGCSELKDLPENIGNLIGLKKLEIIGTAVREPPSSIFLIENLEVRHSHGSGGTLFIRRPNPLHLKLPSLSCLHSLAKLELSDCNLRAVPNDIDSLHLLENLNLRKNNFVCFPESIIRQSKLQDIHIENCTGLRSLPHFPLSTQSIWAHGCTSLEILPDQLKMLLRYFQSLYYKDMSGTDRFDLIVPGRKIPKWFSHQSAGASVTLSVPPNFDEKCSAIGMCAAFEHLPSGLGGLFDRRHMLVCSITFCPNGLDRSTAFKECISFSFPEKIGQVKQSHLWLIYLRREYFGDLIDELHDVKFDLQIDFKTEGTGYVHSNGLYEIEENEFDHQTEFKTEGTGLKVNKCGVHFVFEQDIEYLSQINEMDFVSNGEGSFSDVAGTSGEGGFRDCSKGSFSDEGGPGGEGSFSDEARPSGEGGFRDCSKGSFSDEAGPSGEGSFRDCSEGSFSDEARPSGEGGFRDCSKGSFSDEPRHSGEGSSIMTGTERIWNLNQIRSLMLRLGNCLGICCVDDHSDCQESV